VRFRKRVATILALIFSLSTYLADPPPAHAESEEPMLCGVPYNVAREGTAVSDLSVHLETPMPTIGQYTITFRTSEKGALAPGDQITITFPCMTGIAIQGLPLDLVLLNGTPIGTPAQRAVAEIGHLTLPVPVAIPANTLTTLTILPSIEGIKNPPLGSYELFVTTSADKVAAKTAFVVPESHFFYFNTQEIHAIGAYKFFPKTWGDPILTGRLTYVTNGTPPDSPSIVATVTSESDPIGIKVVLNQVDSPLFPVFSGAFGFTRYSTNPAPNRLKVMKPREQITARVGNMTAVVTWIPST
jgi:hypothetical protein